MRKKGIGLQGKFHIRNRTLFVKKKCLKCGKVFESESIGNRICVPCNVSNQKIYL